MTITGPSGRGYDPLPINNAGGFPQRFALNLGKAAYQFLLYVNAPAVSLDSLDEIMNLPDKYGRFLVVRVDRVVANTATTTLFLRKVTPSLEYQAGPLGLYFPTQIVARRNFNASGAFGSNVIGGVASS